MSALTNQTSVTAGDYLFILKNGSVQTLNISSLTTNNIILDAIQMDCGYIGPASTPTLLLNGVPVAATSSFTSSITSWSQYPAIAPITYTGGGGVANFTNVNAAANVSSLTANAQALTVSSINGLTFPSAILPVLSFAGASPIINGGSYTVDFTSLSAGFYLLIVSIQGGSGIDPMTCSCMFHLTGGNLNGGTIHIPVLASGVPSFANCVVIQDTILGATTQVTIYSNDNTTGLGITPQFSVYRIS